MALWMTSLLKENKLFCALLCRILNDPSIALSGRVWIFEFDNFSFWTKRELLPDLFSQSFCLKFFSSDTTSFSEIEDPALVLFETCQESNDNLGVSSSLLSESLSLAKDRFLLMAWANFVKAFSSSSFNGWSQFSKNFSPSRISYLSWKFHEFFLSL